MTTPIFRNIVSIQNNILEDWGPLAPPLATPIEGELLTRGTSLWKSSDGEVKTGVWQCTPGKSRWEFLLGGEFIHLLSGEMTIEEDGEVPITLRAGDTATFPVGWKGTWTITETIRKVYTIF